MLHLVGLATLGKDAQIRDHNGTAVATLALAFSYGRKGDDGKRPTTWVDAALWGKLATAMESYLLKGKQVMVVLEDVHLETFERAGGGTGTKIAARVASIELARGQRDDAPSPPPPPPPKQQQSVDDDDIPF